LQKQIIIFLNKSIKFYFRKAIMRLFFIYLLICTIHLQAQNLPVFRPTDKTKSNTQMPEHELAARNQQKFNLHFVAPFSEWWGSTFMELTDRDVQPAKALYPPTYESYIVNKN